MLVLIVYVVIVVSMLGAYAARREGLGALFGRQVACLADGHVTGTSVTQRPLQDRKRDER